MSGRHRFKEWRKGADEFRISEQYAGKPEAGLVVTVRQATTGSGRSVLLPLADVVELRDWLNVLVAPAGSPEEQHDHA